MANKIYKKDFGSVCPRCGSTLARVCVYHFGATYTAECAGCGLAQVEGDDEDTAIARLRGKYLDAQKTP